MPDPPPAPALRDGLRDALRDGRLGGRFVQALAAVVALRFLALPAVLGRLPAGGDPRTELWTGPWWPAITAELTAPLTATTALVAYALAYRHLPWPARSGTRVPTLAHARFLGSVTAVPLPVLVLEHSGHRTATLVLFITVLGLTGLTFGDLWRALSAPAGTTAAGVARRTRPGEARHPRRVSVRVLLARPDVWALRALVVGALLAAVDVWVGLWVHALSPLLYAAAVPSALARRLAPVRPGARARLAAAGRLRVRATAALRRPAARYALPALGTAVALALAVGLRDDASGFQRGSMLFFFASVVASSVLGGLRPGLLATLLAVAAMDFFLLAPLHSFAVDAEAAGLLAVFNVMAVLASWLLAERAAVDGPNAPSGSRRWRAPRRGGPATRGDR
jgi:hypothetical protein